MGAYDIFDRVRGLGWQAGVGLSIAAALLSGLFAVVIVVHWPPGQFRGDVEPEFLPRRPLPVRVVGILAKNVAGYVIILLGALMAVPGVPGQGLLMILIGLTLINFPGKRKMEHWLIARKAVRRTLNAVRRWFNRPPLEVD